MNGVNFIPESFFQARARRRAILRVGVLTGLLAVAGAAWLTWQGQQEERQLRARLKTLEKQTTILASSDAERRERSSRQALLRKLECPVPSVSIIAEIGRLMPPSMGLTSLSLEGQPVVPAARDDDRKRRRKGASGEQFPVIKLALEGVAPDDVTVAKMIGRLDAEPLFENVELGFSRPAENETLVAREFQILAEIPLNRAVTLTATAGTEAGDAD